MATKDQLVRHVGHIPFNPGEGVTADGMSDAHQAGPAPRMYRRKRNVYLSFSERWTRSLRSAPTMDARRMTCHPRVPYHLRPNASPDRWNRISRIWLSTL